MGLSNLNDCIVALADPLILKDLENRNLDAIFFASSILGFDDIQNSLAIE